MTVEKSQILLHNLVNEAWLGRSNHATNEISRDRNDGVRIVFKRYVGVYGNTYSVGVESVDGRLIAGAQLIAHNSSDIRIESFSVGITNETPVENFYTVYNYGPLNRWVVENRESFDGYGKNENGSGSGNGKSNGHDLFLDDRFRLPDKIDLNQTALNYLQKVNFWWHNKPVFETADPRPALVGKAKLG